MRIHLGIAFCGFLLLYVACCLHFFLFMHQQQHAGIFNNIRNFFWMNLHTSSSSHIQYSFLSFHLVEKKFFCKKQKNCAAFMRFVFPIVCIGIFREAKKRSAAHAYCTLLLDVSIWKNYESM